MSKRVNLKGFRSCCSFAHGVKKRGYEQEHNSRAFAVLAHPSIYREAMSNKCLASQYGLLYAGERKREGSSWPGREFANRKPGRAAPLILTSTQLGKSKGVSA